MGCGKNAKINFIICVEEIFHGFAKMHKNSHTLFSYPVHHTNKASITLKCTGNLYVNMYVQKINFVIHRRSFIDLQNCLDKHAKKFA